jgi:hypothetical protein
MKQEYLESKSMLSQLAYKNVKFCFFPWKRKQVDDPNKFYFI